MTTRVGLVPPIPLLLAGLVLLFVGAFAAAAYWDWIWWEPYNAVLPYLGEGALFLVAIVCVTIPRARPLALVAAVVGLGLVSGQLLGPSRPELLHGDGTVTVRLATPVSAVGSAGATCTTSESGTEFQMSGNPNLRMDIFPDNSAAPSDIDQSEFVNVYLAIGDRWRRSDRPDGNALHISIGRVEAELPESRMMAGPSSRLTIDGTPDGGHALFAGLRLETRTNEQAGEFVDVGGTLEWLCTYAGTRP